MENITTILVSITAFITAVSGLLISIKKAKKEVEETIPKKVKNQSNINMDIINRMEFLKEYLKADRIQIYDFHNGGHYANGRSALKTTCTFEVVRAGVKKCQMELQSIPLSCIPHFIDELLNKNSLDVGNLEQIKDSMPSTYSLKKCQSIKSFYDVVITNKAKEPIGFLGIQYVTNTHKPYNENERNEILKLKFFIEENLEKMIK